MAAKQSYGFVWCSLFIIVLILSSSSESADPLSQCPPQLPRTRYLKASDWGKCYEFHMEERTWRTANSICGTKGGHLVTIKEERVQSFLLKALSDYRWPRNGLWIGATDKEKEMEWLWVTGERVKDGYSKWASGQPSCGFLCFEDCALMRWKEGGRWHDYRCNWLEDYSFICEYDMLPEPTTPTTTTAASTTASTTATTTTSAATSNVVPDNTTSFFLTSSTRTLESEYLLHVNREKWIEENIMDKAEKNRSDVLLTPEVMVQGVNGAKAEHVQESTSISGMDSGMMAFIIITILIILVVGLCFTLIFMRRRHRKQNREDDIGISYENPYYEETKAPLNRKNGDCDTDSETHVHGDCADPAVCTGKDDGAHGVAVIAAAKKGTEVKPPPIFLARPRCVMNTYDTPPTQNTHLPVCTSKKVSDKRAYCAAYKSVAKEANQMHACPILPKEMSDYCDRVQTNSTLTYDVPRASRHQHYQNNDLDHSDDSPAEEQMYYNYYDENIYESVDNLQGMLEQQRHAQTEEESPQNVKDGENQYVPFPQKEII